MRTVLTALVLAALAAGAAFAQVGNAAGNAADEVRKGHQLAALLCANCHVAAPDQPFPPILNPPAPSFASIVARKDFDAEAVAKFITTTHRGLDNPNGMPNPYLVDYQVKEIVAYLLSLRRAEH